MKVLAAEHITNAYRNAKAEDKQEMVRYLFTGRLTNGDSKDEELGAKTAANLVLDLLDSRFDEQCFDLMATRLVQNQSEDFAKSFAGVVALTAIHLDPPAWN